MNNGEIINNNIQEEAENQNTSVILHQVRSLY